MLGPVVRAQKDGELVETHEKVVVLCALETVLVIAFRKSIPTGGFRSPDPGLIRPVLSPLSYSRFLRLWTYVQCAGNASSLLDKACH